MEQESDRTLDGIVLPQWGRVEPSDGPVPWTVVTDEGLDLVVVQQYLREVVARGGSPLTTRSYAYDLLRWWRWLMAVGVPAMGSSDIDGGEGLRTVVAVCNEAAAACTYDFGRHRWNDQPMTESSTSTISTERARYDIPTPYFATSMRTGLTLVRGHSSTRFASTTGPPGDLMPATIRCSRSGPKGAWHITPNCPNSTRERSLMSAGWNCCCPALRAHRDRALLSLTVSSAARSAEILGLVLADVDWGEQLIRVHRKGSRAPQWLPASPESFVWLGLYLADLATPLKSQDALWWTLRRRDRGNGLTRQPMEYEALRAVFRRVN